MKKTKILDLLGLRTDSIGLQYYTKMKVNFVFFLFFVWFLETLAEQNGSVEVPSITSLTMCLARGTFLKKGFAISNTSPATKREHATKRRKKRQARCPLTTPYYRTADGECNNLRYPNRGRSFERFKRFLPPQYDDGISIPRLHGTCRNDLSYYGCYPSKLPSPRLISTAVHTPDPNPTTSINSVMLMQWGQFLDHDFTAAAIEQPADLRTCCSESRAKVGRPHSDTFRRRGMCFPISMLKTTKDRFFDALCMDFIRSRPVNPEMSVNKPREQQNLLTAFIDASNVYGSDQETQDRLRGPDGRMATSAGGALLPKGRDSDCILSTAPYCFDAGDERVHVYPGLTALHTLFVRFHNYIADEFKFSTNWDDDTIFQETRKIIAAFMQKITYKEFLPELLNKETIKRFKLDNPYRYDIHIDPSIANSFATAAFRFGHSLIPDFFIINGTKVLSRKLFNDPQFIFNHFDDVVDNVLTNQAEVLDRFLTLEITDHLFEIGDISFDLASFNIQRGRDHGLPPYNHFRQWCGMPRVRSFYSAIFGRLGPVMDQLYNHVDELDLFTGAMVERPEPGSAVGPVLSCILAQQFHDLKHGDSFWYETKDQRRGFTPEQLAAIEKTSFSSLLCDHFDRTSIQMNPFRVVSNSNPLVDCSSIPHFDISPWLLNKK